MAATGNTLAPLLPRRGYRRREFGETWVALHFVASSGTLEKARSTPVAVIHEDDLVSSCFIQKRSLQSNLLCELELFRLCPQKVLASAHPNLLLPASPFSDAFPPGFTPGELLLGPLPRSSSLISNGSTLSLQRTSSVQANGRPYPPGLGWTPQVTPHDEGLQRKLSFGFSLEEPKLRRTTTDLDAVLEAQMQDHYFSRELLLFYAGAVSDPQESSPAEAGFLWPKPGFFRMQPIDASEKATAETQKKVPQEPKPKTKPEPKVPPPPPKANNPKEGKAVHTGKGSSQGANGTGWKGYGKGQGWHGWQGWPKGWSKGWETWGW
ncbi:unnamed protein product [Cladocopium goreaui]|uniref:Uncharacterized protein n=1 Tax=Cladocopium goreaui TaxID=2562237 RepID=A0A9P1DLR3_9DINO|nr:unnamed protein product [Cladocopium goreaui]